MKEIRRYIRKILSESSVEENFIKVFHGTSIKNLESIKRDGLVNERGYGDAQWYMVSTDFQSAIFHSRVNEGDEALVVEFKVPVTNKHWDGNPQFWPPHEREDDSKWYALKEPISKDNIENIYKIPYEEFVKYKNKGL